MKRLVLVLLMVFSLQTTIAQEYEMVRHQVQLGETVRMISRKYKVEPAEIYRLNKFAVDGISQGMVLQLMVPKKDVPAETVTSDVQVDESTTVAANDPPQGSDDESTTTTTTKKVTTTTIKKKKTTESQTTSEEVPVEAEAKPSSGETGSTGSAVAHKVTKGETLFSIARKYNTTVDEIKNQNGKVLAKGLQPGQVLTIITSGSGEPAQATAAPVKDPPVSETVTTTESASASQTEIKHTVAKGETLYSLSRKYNVTVDDIKMQNEQALKKGLQVGQVLTIRTSN